MKTVFEIVADTKAMTVTLNIRQGAMRYSKGFASVTDAATFLLNGIGAVMSKRPDKLYAELQGDET